MGSLTLNGATSGAVTISPPAVAGTNTLTLPAATGTVLTTAGGQTISGTVTLSTLTSPAATALTIQAAGATAVTIDTSVNLNMTGGGQIIAGNGTVTTPSIVFSGSQATGFYRPAAGTIGFVYGGTESMRIDSSGYMQGTVNGLGAGRIPAMQFYRLNSGLAGANVSTAQNIFGVGVTLVGSTVYAFEAVVLLSKSAGVTGHTVAYGYGGTATINNISGLISSQYSQTSFESPLAGGGNYQMSGFTSAAGATPIGNSNAATIYWTVLFKGTVSVNAGGTFIPQYTLSAAPGGAYTTAAGSYFAIYPLGASGANTSIGTWA